MQQITGDFACPGKRPEFFRASSADAPDTRLFLAASTLAPGSLASAPRGQLTLQLAAQGHPQCVSAPPRLPSRVPRVVLVRTGHAGFAASAGERARARARCLAQHDGGVPGARPAIARFLPCARAPRGRSSESAIHFLELPLPTVVLTPVQPRSRRGS